MIRYDLTGKVAALLQYVRRLGWQHGLPSYSQARMQNEDVCGGHGHTLQLCMECHRAIRKAALAMAILHGEGS